jgi:hypothetical protein
VRITARQVERFAGRQRDVAMQRERRDSRAAVELLRLERQRDERFVDAPRLRALDLQRQRVVRVVMDIEALCAGGCEVDVRADVGAQVALQAVARAL